MKDKTRLFLKIFKAARKKYGRQDKRLAAEGWERDWQTLIGTIMSAQSRDEVTLPTAEALFEEYDSLEKLANARYKDVYKIFKHLNYNKTKAKHVMAAAKMIIDNFNGKVPENLNDLLKLPGVGRKVANIVLVEVHGKHAIPVDTHVHRLSNVLGIVKTKTPEQTEIELMKIVPKKYWVSVNRIFVLWGQDVPGRDKKRLLKHIGLN